MNPAIPPTFYLVITLILLYMLFHTHQESETKLLGQKFAKQIRGGDVVVLSGNLGSGKTVFIKGLALGLEIKKNVRSPSFNLMKTYKTAKKIRGVKNLIHLDCYRLLNQQEVIDTGLLDYLAKKDTLVAIEWPEKISQLLKKYPTKKIKFTHLKETERKIKIT